MRAAEAGDLEVVARQLAIACDRGDIEGCNLLGDALRDRLDPSVLAEIKE